MKKQSLLFNLILSTSLSTSCLAAEEETTVPRADLFLIATESQVKLQNQTLEYKVIDNDTIKVGNVVISSKNMNLSKKTPDELTFEAPLQFLVGATLILKDPHGKAIWSQVVADASQIETAANEDLSPASNLAKSGVFHLKDIGKVESQLAQNSYFSYCLYSETKMNRIQLCTPNYSLAQKEGIWQPVVLDSKRKEPFILVNGQEVNETGIIQFDKNIKTASLAALLTSGLSVELRTDFVPLELLDITYNQTEKSINLKAREKNSSKKKNPIWDTKVSLEDPFLFIEAAGQVPLRQLLTVNEQNLPVPSDRPTLINNPHRTYSSSLVVRIEERPKLSLNSRTAGDSIEIKSPEFLWTLNNLNIGYNKPHFLEIASDKKKFMGAYEVERGRGLELGLNLGGGSMTTTTTINNQSVSLSDSSTVFDLSVKKFYDGFFGMTTPTHYLRWGTQLAFSSHSYSTSKVKSSQMDLDLSYRLSPGFYMIDASTNLKLGIRSTSNAGPTQTTQSQWLGAKLSHEGPNSNFVRALGHFHAAEIGILPVCLTEACKGSMVIDASWQSRYTLSPKSYLSWKLMLELVQTKNDSTQSNNTSRDFQVGAGMLF